MTTQREATARRIATWLGIHVADSAAGMIPDYTRSTKETTMAPSPLPRPNRQPGCWPCGRRSTTRPSGRGFDCFVEDAVCNLGVADWHGREAIRQNLRDFI